MTNPIRHSVTHPDRPEPRRAEVRLTVLWRGPDAILVREFDFSEAFYLPCPAARTEREGCGSMIVSMPVDLARKKGLIP